MCEKSLADIVVQIGSDSMGRGDNELGGRLVNSFLNVLQETGMIPSTIIFFNSGVYLAAEGSVALEPLRDLENAGVTILSCGTCLDHFDLKKKLAVGKVSNMFEIAQTMLKADKVIPL